jgi:aminocarboxymuconate-semialdehyde decarboxylase
VIADIHAHIVDLRHIRELAALLQLELQETPDGKTLLRKNGFTYAWTRPDMFDIPRRIAEMDRKGIDLRLLSLSTPNVYDWKGEAQTLMARHVNNALAELCGNYPERFAGLASLPLDDVAASVIELERAVDKLGMVGVIIGSNIDGKPLNDGSFDPLWARINERRLPVFEHPMFPKDTSNLGEFELPLRVGLIFDTTLVATRLIYSGLFERYPDFPYIMAHTGGALLMMLERLDNGYRLFPDCREFISRLPSEYARELYYDTTAFDAASLRLALDAVGPQHLLFGTDDPFIDSDTSHVRRLGLTDDDERAILGGNVARLFGLSGAGA